MSLRVKIRQGTSEIEVEGDREFIEQMLARFLDRLSDGGAIHQKDLPKKIIESADREKRKDLAPSEFLREKKPTGGTEQLLVLGRYLEEYRSFTEFSRDDVNKLAAEAKIKNIHGQYFTLAVQQGLVRQLNKGKYALTLSGEDAVAAMTATPKE